jgi:amino acid transporter
MVHRKYHGDVYRKLRYVSSSVLLLPPSFVLTSAVAELVSAYPTAGGMYFVTKHVVPKEYVAIWAWVIGWCNFLGQAGGVASLAYTISQMILAAAVMNSDYVDGAYSFSP